jgi:hypothetical protein
LALSGGRVTVLGSDMEDAEEDEGRILNSSRRKKIYLLLIKPRVFNT